MAETSRLDDVAKAPLAGSIGVVLPAGAEQATAANKVDALIALGREAVEVALGSLWLSQQFDHDALSVAAILGQAVPDIALGTSVVPIYPRHPMVVFSQAQTAQAASHGRFTLGIGFGPPQFAEAFGVPFDRPIRHLREYLTALGSLSRPARSTWSGRHYEPRPPDPPPWPGPRRRSRWSSPRWDHRRCG